jgi:hypothetical protein
MHPIVLVKHDPFFLSGNQEFVGVFSCFPAFLIQTKRVELPVSGYAVWAATAE